MLYIYAEPLHKLFGVALILQETDIGVPKMAMVQPQFSQPKVFECSKYYHDYTLKMFTVTPYGCQ